MQLKKDDRMNNKPRSGLQRDLQTANPSLLHPPSYHCILQSKYNKLDFFYFELMYSYNYVRYSSYLCTVTIIYGIHPTYVQY